MTNEAQSNTPQHKTKAVVVIADRDNTKKLEEFLREKHLLLNYMFNGEGTARSEVLKSLGLSGTEKTICAIVVPTWAADTLMASVADRLSLTVPGNGIVFIVPISGISAVVLNILNDENNRERVESHMETGIEEKLEEAGYSLVVSVIDKGFSEKLMNTARSVGARGGTIINARRSGMEDAVKFFGVTLQAEKEVVTILIQSQQKKEMMQAIAKTCGLNTDAHGIILSLPVESCSGIHKGRE